jgi:hypothetical protein
MGRRALPPEPAPARLLYLALAVGESGLLAPAPLRRLVALMRCESDACGGRGEEVAPALAASAVGRPVAGLSARCPSRQVRQAFRKSKSKSRFAMRRAGTRAKDMPKSCRRRRRTATRGATRPRRGPGSRWSGNDPDVPVRSGDGSGCSRSGWWRLMSVTTHHHRGGGRPVEHRHGD